VAGHAALDACLDGVKLFESGDGFILRECDGGQDQGNWREKLDDASKRIPWTVQLGFPLAFRGITSARDVTKRPGLIRTQVATHTRAPHGLVVTPSS
jgi:hypothetical protein